MDPDPTIVFRHFWSKKAKTIIVYESSVVMWSRSNLEPAPEKKKFKLKIQDSQIKYNDFAFLKVYCLYLPIFLSICEKVVKI